MVGTGRVTATPIEGASQGADGRYDAKGTKLRSLFVVLISTGDPISSSCDLDELRARDAARFEASLSFKPRKSANSGVEGMCGDADALRACLTTFGDKKASAGGYVADLGVHGDGSGIGDVPGLAEPRRGDGSGLKGAGGTGFR